MAPSGRRDFGFVAIVEPDADLAHALAGFVERHYGLRCRVFPVVEQARAALALSACRAAVIDADAAQRDAASLVDLRQRRPGLAILITAGDGATAVIDLVSRLGARVLGKPCSVTDARPFFEEIRVAAATDAAIAEVVSRLARSRRLSPQERRVLEGALDHASHEEIGDRVLRVERGTIRGYVTSLLCKRGEPSVRALCRRLVLEARSLANVETEDGTPAGAPPSSCRTGAAE